MIPSKPSPTLKDPSKHSPEFNDFLAKCVEKNPELRPKAEELLNASFPYLSCFSFPRKSWLTHYIVVATAVDNNNSTPSSPTAKVPR